MLVSVIGGFTILYNCAVEIQLHFSKLFKIELIFCLEHKFLKIKIHLIELTFYFAVSVTGNLQNMKPAQFAHWFHNLKILYCIPVTPYNTQ